MRRFSPYLLGAALAVASAGCATTSTAGSPARSTPRLDEARAGRPALVSLWATWCEACSSEFGALNRLDARARAHGAVVLGVAVGETAPDVATFARARGLRYMQVADPSFEITDALGERRVPTTLVVDRAGRVVFRGGALDEEALRAFERVEAGDRATTAASP